MIAPYIANPTTKPIAEADEKTRFANKCGAMIGSDERRSAMMKMTVKMTPATSSPIEPGEAQANDVPPSEVNKISPDAAIVKVTIPR